MSVRDHSFLTCRNKAGHRFSTTTSRSGNSILFRESWQRLACRRSPSGFHNATVPLTSPNRHRDHGRKDRDRRDDAAPEICSRCIDLPSIECGFAPCGISVTCIHSHLKSASAGRGFCAAFGVGAPTMPPAGRPWRNRSSSAGWPGNRAQHGRTLAGRSARTGRPFRVFEAVGIRFHPIQDDSRVIYSTPEYSSENTKIMSFPNKKANA